MPTDVVKALLPVLAAGFAFQRLLEILDPVVIRFTGKEKKKYYLGLLSLAAGLLLAFQAELRVLFYLGIDTNDFKFLDYLVSGLIVSAGTDSVNSILKFLNYKKEEQKEEAKAEMLNVSSARTLLNLRRINMDPIADNLVRVIDGWSDNETGMLNRGKSLERLWDQRHLGAIPYDPDGIDKLINRIRKNNFFITDPQVKVQANALGHGMFVSGGGIQTEGDLYDFLAS